MAPIMTLLEIKVKSKYLHIYFNLPRYTSYIIIVQAELLGSSGYQMLDWDPSQADGKQNFKK